MARVLAANGPEPTGRLKRGRTATRGVACDHLGYRPGDPECGTHHEPDDGTRQSKPGHHESIAAVGVAEQRLGHGRQGHGAGSEGKAQGGAEHERPGAEEELGYVPEGTGGRTRRRVPLGRSHST